jgi:AraC-like DNA-binding protein
MQHVPLMRAAALRPLAEFLDRAGASSSRVLGPRLHALREADVLLPFSVGARAYALGTHSLGESALGLFVGESTRLERVPMGAVLRGAATLGCALQTLVRRSALYNTGQRFWLVARGEDAWLHCALAPNVTRGRSAVRDLTLALALSLVRRVAGSSWKPREIHFEGAPPEHAERLAALAARGASFGHRSTSFPFSYRVLAAPLPEPAPLPSYAPGLAAPSTDPLASLSQAVEGLLSLGEPEIAAAAEAAGVSVRTLQRHLRDAGDSFGELVARLRLRAAARLLADPDLKVIEISASLGYTDSANFTRAFRRWTGLSPQAFRRAARELPVPVSRVTSAPAGPTTVPIG